MTTNTAPVRERGGLRHHLFTGLGVLLIVVLLPVLVMNLTLLAKSYLNQDQVPAVGGYLPLIVLTDSMYPGIQSGDLIICHTVDAEQVAVGDVIAFFDPAGNGTSVVTHRVIAVTEENGSLAFQTQGDANNVADALLVPAANLVGTYRTRIAGAGRVAMFMQTTTGLIVCVLVPLVLLVSYDVLRRRIYDRAQQRDNAQLLEELEALRAQKAQRETDEATEA
jgi:signal peptidase